MIGRYNWIAVRRFGLGFMLITSFLRHSHVDAKLYFMKPRNTSDFEEVVLEASVYDGFYTSNIGDFAADSPYMPVINLFEADLGAEDGFDICDESTYPTSGGLSFNKTLKLPNGNRTSTTKWLALWTSALPYAPDRCPRDVGVPKWVMFTMYQAKYAQQLGASAMIHFYRAPIKLGNLAAHSKPPNVDAVKKIVDGIEIKIPAVTVIGTEEDYSAIVNPKVGQVWIKSASLADTDANWMLDEIAKPFGLFMISTWLCILYQAYLSWVIVTGIKHQRMSTREKGNSASKRIALMRYLILVPELVKCFATAVFMVDPLAIFNVPGFNFTDSTILNWFITGMSNFSDITMSFYCYEVFCLFRSTEKMQKNVSVLEKYAWITPFIIAVASVLVGLRVYIITMYYKGESTSSDRSIYNILIVYGMISTFGVAIYLNCLSQNSSNLIKKLGKGKEGTGSIKAKPSSVQTTNLSKMTGYMTKTSAALYFYYIVLFCLTISGWSGSGPLEFGFTTMLSSGVIPSISSTFQIFAATVMIPKAHTIKTLMVVTDKSKYNTSGGLSAASSIAATTTTTTARLTTDV